VTDDDGEPAHELVHWETISELVVSPAAGGRVDTVGLRLRADPGGVRHRQVVDGWGFRRPALEAAVARFSGDRVGVGEETPPRPGLVYLARPTLRPSRQTVIIGSAFVVLTAGQAYFSGLPVVLVGILLLVAAPFALVARVVSRLPTVSLRVSREGIVFGAGPGGPTTGEQHVWWPQVSSVVLFTVAGDPQRRPAVGVRAGEPPRITTYRVTNGWRLDEARLRAAVQAHRPDLPVEDLGEVPPGDLPNPHA
jgi:hypothetical protein